LRVPELEKILWYILINTDAVARFIDGYDMSGPAPKFMSKIDKMLEHEKAETKRASARKRSVDNNNPHNPLDSMPSIKKVRSDSEYNMLDSMPSIKKPKQQPLPDDSSMDKEPVREDVIKSEGNDTNIKEKTDDKKNRGGALITLQTLVSAGKIPVGAVLTAGEYVATVTRMGTIIANGEEYPTLNSWIKNLYPTSSSRRSAWSHCRYQGRRLSEYKQELLSKENQPKSEEM